MIKLEESRPTLEVVLPSTRHFEVHSEAVGSRFAIGVRVMMRYGAEPERAFPLVNQPEGNKAAPTAINALLQDDPIAPIEPPIQVPVGYTGEDLGRMLAVRARDLLPPGEPLSEDANEESMVGVWDYAGHGWATDQALEHHHQDTEWLVFLLKMLGMSL